MPILYKLLSQYADSTAMVNGIKVGPDGVMCKEKNDALEPFVGLLLSSEEVKAPPADSAPAVDSSPSTDESADVSEPTQDDAGELDDNGDTKYSREYLESLSLAELKEVAGKHGINGRKTHTIIASMVEKGLVDEE